jgi:hypothetical protein
MVKPKSRRLWSDQDKQALRDNWKTRSDPELAASLGRSVQSIQLMRHRLGLLRAAGKESRRWSDWQTATLRRLHSIVDEEALAERLGRTVEAVRGKLRRMGLRNRKVHDWTEAELALVRQHKRGAPRQPLADALGLEVGRVGSMLAIVRRKEGLAKQRVPSR